jgi:hypothetical protein
MSFLGLFKKKEEDFSDFNNLDSQLNSGLELDDLNNTSTPNSSMEFDFEEPKKSSVREKFEMNEFNAYNNVSKEQVKNSDTKTDELILAKLDTLKSEMTNINHRLDKIEEGLKKRW